MNVKNPLHLVQALEEPVSIPQEKLEIGKEIWRIMVMIAELSQNLK